MNKATYIQNWRSKYLKVFMIILLVSTTSGCSLFSTKNRCERMIPEKEMVNILTEIFLLEAQSGNPQVPASIRDSIGYYYAGIFQKYEIDSKTFEDAYECYLQDQEQFTRLTDEVLSSLSIMQTKISETQ